LVFLLFFSCFSEPSPPEKNFCRRPCYGVVVYNDFLIFTIYLTVHIIGPYLASMHVQNKTAFSEGRLLSSQSQQYKKYSKISDWLEESRPFKKATFVLVM